jgi:hypothetical protein
MDNPVTVIMPIVLLGILYVIVPVAADTYRRFRRPRLVVCPQNGFSATVQLDAARAVTTSVDGDPVVEIRSCSRWPEIGSCRRTCLGQIDPLGAA